MEGVVWYGTVSLAGETPPASLYCTPPRVMYVVGAVVLVRLVAEKLCCQINVQDVRRSRLTAAVEIYSLLLSFTLTKLTICYGTTKGTMTTMSINTQLSFFLETAKRRETRKGRGN